MAAEFPEGGTRSDGLAFTSAPSKRGQGVKLTTTLRRRKHTVKTERVPKEPSRHGPDSAWVRARYEQAPEMIPHMLQVR